MSALTCLTILHPFESWNSHQSRTWQLSRIIVVPIALSSTKSATRRCRWKLGVILASDISVGMSLYYDAASVLSSSSQDGSLKSRIYNSKNFKSKPAHIYALISETTKYDGFLKELIENSGILALEPKVCNQLFDPPMSMLTDLALDLVCVVEPCPLSPARP
jgi:hypothetical protein